MPHHKPQQYINPRIFAALFSRRLPKYFLRNELTKTGAVQMEPSANAHAHRLYVLIDLWVCFRAKHGKTHTHRMCPCRLLKHEWVVCAFNILNASFVSVAATEDVCVCASQFTSDWIWWGFFLSPLMLFIYIRMIDTVLYHCHIYRSRNFYDDWTQHVRWWYILGDSVFIHFKWRAITRAALKFIAEDTSRMLDCTTVYSVCGKRVQPQWNPDSDICAL